MTITLHKYIFKDLIKTFVLATIGLTMVLSLGSILQPLQTYGISPSQAIVLILYFVPVMLTFVMPVSALFAAALTYGRFASDNELDACRASGVGTMNMMFSAMMLAVIVAVANLLLNFYVVPHYIHKAEASVKSNVRNIVFRSIERQGFYNFRDKSKGSSAFILADKVDLQNNMLWGVNILQIKTGKPKSLISVGQADVDFESTDSYNYISALAQDVYQADNSGLVYSMQLPIKGKFPPMLIDHMRFKRLSELKEIKDDVLKFNPVNDHADRVLVRLRSELLAEQIAHKKANTNDPLYELRSDDKIIRFQAGSCTVSGNDTKISLTDIKVYEYNVLKPGVLVNTWSSFSGSLEIDEQWQQSQWTLLLDNAGWVDDKGVTGLPVSHNVRGLHTPKTISDALAGYKLDVIENVTPQEESEKLAALKTRMQYMLASTGAALMVEVNSRLVLGLGCILLVLCGSALGILFKGGHLLTSFGISAVPAGILVIFIVMGNNLAKNIARSGTGTGDTGILLMWCGLVVLLILLAAIYRKLLRT